MAITFHTPLQITHPSERSFPLQITEKNPLRIPRSQVTCFPLHREALDFFHVKEIILVNQKAEKTSFSESDVLKMVKAISSLLLYKLCRERARETTDVLAVVRTSHTFIYSVRQIKETSDKLGFAWKFQTQE